MAQSPGAHAPKKRTCVGPTPDDNEVKPGRWPAAAGTIGWLCGIWLWYTMVVHSYCTCTYENNTFYSKILFIYIMYTMYMIYVGNYFQIAEELVSVASNPSNWLDTFAACHPVASGVLLATPGVHDMPCQAVFAPWPWNGSWQSFLRNPQRSGRRVAHTHTHTHSDLVLLDVDQTWFLEISGV